jgi:glycosyltransferase involved in cell wall biosynthesis
MKVLFDHNSPFLLAHGGFQIQIEQTKAALEQTGVEVEYLRWWDERQTGDIIHYFGRPWKLYCDTAQNKGIKIVVGDLLTGLGSRSAFQRGIQKLIMVAVRQLLPCSLRLRLAWDTFEQADACVALTPWEARLMREMFNAPASKLHVIPNGVEETFLRQPTAQVRKPWLVCTATITERKRVLELAQACVVAKVPLKVIGRPYSESDPYGRSFTAYAKQHPDFILYDGPVRDRGRMAEEYAQARGFVLLSTMESLSLSALEATACRCPLMLSDLPWARTVFETDASYCPVGWNTEKTAAALKSFYENAPKLPVPPRPLSWLHVGQELKSLYESLLVA